MQNLAFYSENFTSYDITDLNDFNSLIVKGCGICDFVNSDISELVFKDCKKKYVDLISKNNSIFHINSDLRIKNEKVNVIKIVIRGFDENLDSLIFDTEILNLTSAYRYSISASNIEIVFNIDDNATKVIKFLRNLHYKYAYDFLSNDKIIFIYADGDLVYNEKLKNTQEYI